ncbi:hypothetical protein J7E49_16910 [Variovorax paradoxus]|nr:hypothetical protein [Variovorax paradoxus]
MPEAKSIGAANKTGISGVQHRVTDPRHPGWWLALTYLGNGKSLQKSFSIKIYGNDAAKAMAMAERQRQLQQVQQLREAQKSQNSRSVDEESQSTQAETILQRQDKAAKCAMAMTTDRYQRRIPQDGEFAHEISR